MFVAMTPVANVLSINSTGHKVISNKIIYTNEQYGRNASIIQFTMPSYLRRADLTRIQQTIFDRPDLQLNRNNASISNNLQIRYANARSTTRLVAFNPAQPLLTKPFLEF